MRRRSTLPGRYQPSTIDVLRLNFCVRNGNRWNPQAIATAKGELSWSGVPWCALRYAVRCSQSSWISLSLIHSLRTRAAVRSRLTPRCPLGSHSPSHPDNRTGRTDHFCVGLGYRLNQAFDRLVSSSCMRYRTSTDDLSTLSSSRGLSCLRTRNLLLKVGFTLRCLQRLSRPHFASLLCRWHDNSCTRGASIPVLSY